MPNKIEQVTATNRMSKIKPQPQPPQEMPRPKPKRSCRKSKIASTRNNFSRPERQPGRLFMGDPPYCVLSISYCISDSFRNTEYAIRNRMSNFNLFYAEIRIPTRLTQGLVKTSSSCGASDSSEVKSCPGQWRCSCIPVRHFGQLVTS